MASDVILKSSWGSDVDILVEFEEGRSLLVRASI
jgi:predicted nucleotidyltransferase